METPVKKKNEELRIKEYTSVFLQPTEFKAKSGKSVYISPDFHEKLATAAFMFGNGKLNISDYLHSILRKHFEEYGKEIKTMYSRRRKPF
ncbi:DUF3408 domain-containing protein [Sphingobacterium siyangense]|uniref:Uncharacterized protein DUF3408 n=1 Tax=Sphingobacterium siyangense TaxID=459529 RepID=A0A562MKA7_9SPHI|nr:DUF3408 domain-containing protein [Sphingobacterium siyangense]TWI20332.1 uncharacterized protein DUF3408 [Sphingobacterium siyangense]